MYTNAPISRMAMSNQATLRICVNLVKEEPLVGCPIIVGNAPAQVFSFWPSARWLSSFWVTKKNRELFGCPFSGFNQSSPDIYDSVSRDTLAHQFLVNTI